MSTQEFPTPERKLLAAATPVPLAMLRAGMVIRTPALPQPSLINRVIHEPSGAVAKVFVTRPDGAMVLLPSVGEVFAAFADRKLWIDNMAVSGRLSRLCPTVGADPEVFAVDENDEVIPAFMFLPPKQAPVVGQTSTQFYDGFQAEWTTVPYAANKACLSYHADAVRDGMAAVLNAARRLRPKARLSIASSVPIPDQMRKTLDDEHFQLGCSPSENVYDEEPLRVDNPRELPYRSAGWHMHFGFEPRLPDHQAHAAVRMLDRIVGVGMVTFGQAYPYPDRRRLYGRAGEFRHHHTLEYRVPEVLLGAHPSTWNLWWDLARVALWLGVQGLEFLWDAEDDEVRYAINKSDVPLARKILERNERMLRMVVEKVVYNDPDRVQHTLATIYEGIDVAVARPTDIEGNWKLGKPWSIHNNASSEDTTWNGACNIMTRGGKV